MHIYFGSSYTLNFEKASKVASTKQYAMENASNSEKIKLLTFDAEALICAKNEYVALFENHCEISSVLMAPVFGLFNRIMKFGKSDRNPLKGFACRRKIRIK